jgi:chaperonin GroEL (HSP60 family)
VIGKQVEGRSFRILRLQRRAFLDQHRRWTAKLTFLSAHSVADIIRSCLGPKAMLKMLLDPMGGIVLTNDGHAILREIEVSHPAAKSMIELSRTQDEEVGDGTTTVIILGVL